MKCSSQTPSYFAAAAAVLLLTGCSFTTKPGTILGPHVEQDAGPRTHAAAHKHSESHNADRVRSYGGWTPTYYHNRLLFYDDMGQPYFYSGSTRVYISSSSPLYSAARENWRKNQYAYDRWHAVYHKPRYKRSRR
ncbi:MAG: hypothetical protein CVU65_08120 [Deltaproteobacteria bacterium HGW-Deltaproteobacteria-22]|nr:MAG: hypothetical protein CVU65_08120 [Deltaproteobacteria bacterium HGW-Deltaproteobacteria-22]